VKAADLREKSVDDLRDLQKTLARDVFQNRLKNFTNRLDDTSSVKKLRKDLARVKTLLGEIARRNQGAKQAEASAARAALPKKPVVAAPKAAKSAPAKAKAAPAAPKSKPAPSPSKPAPAAKKKTTKAAPKHEAK
jgi:large subunit ribosomal protein L29